MSRAFASEKEYNKAYRAANAQRLSAYRKAYRAANLEHLKERDKARYAANRKRRKAQFKARHAANPEPGRARARAWREANHERIKEYRESNADRISEVKTAYLRAHREQAMQWEKERQARNPHRVRQWREAHPESARLINQRASQRRRAKKSNAEGSHTEAEWRSLVSEFEERCVCCGEHFGLERLTKDHIVPLALGGSDFIENIQPLCARCNSKKGKRHSTDYRGQGRDRARRGGARR